MAHSLPDHRVVKEQYKTLAQKVARPCEKAYQGPRTLRGNGGGGTCLKC